MKYSVVAAAVIIFVVHVSAQNVLYNTTVNNMDVYTTECAKSLSISIDELGRYKPANLTGGIENDTTAQCYSKCIAEKIGIFNDNEGFDLDTYIKTSDREYNETEIRQKFEKCAMENPRNSYNICQWYFDGLKCILKGEV